MKSPGVGKVPKVIVLLAAAILLAIGGCTGKKPDAPAKEGWITDHAGILPEPDKTRMSETLAAYEKETCHQVLVLIVPSLGGEEIRELSERAALAWDIGQKGFGNGILLTIAVQEKTMRIETGAAFEWFIEKGTAERILHETIIPYFTQGKFTEGIEGGLAEIMEAARLKEIPADHRPDICRN